MGYTAWSVTYGEQPSAAKWNYLGANDASFNDGTGIAAAAITTAKIADGAVEPDKLSLGIQTAVQATSGTTTSSSYTATLTSGGTNPSVTVTVPSTGILLILINSRNSNSGVASTITSFALSGTNTVAATDDNSVFNVDTSAASFGGHFLLTGLTPGSTTVTMQYRVSANTGTFGFRRLTVIPLG